MSETPEKSSDNPFFRWVGAAASLATIAAVIWTFHTVHGASLVAHCQSQTFGAPLYLDKSISAIEKAGSGVIALLGSRTATPQSKLDAIQDLKDAEPRPEYSTKSASYCVLKNEGDVQAADIQMEFRVVQPAVVYVDGREVPFVRDAHSVSLGSLRPDSSIVIYAVFGPAFNDIVPDGITYPDGVATIYPAHLTYGALGTIVASLIANPWPVLPFVAYVGIWILVWAWKRFRPASRRAPANRQ